MKIHSILAAAFFICQSGTTYAGFLDDLNRVADTVKKGATLLPNTPGAVNAGAPAGALLPLDLSAYPRSHLKHRVDNPFDQVRIPISVPVKTPDGYVPPYAVPMEGRVTMLQFAHRSDDSPLLIREHYEAWMAQHGFERLLVCESPCPKLPGRYSWRPSIDPSERLDSNYIPDQATYVVGYKQDAMVIVGIGKYIAQHASLFKLVEGRVLDTQPWKIVTAPKAAPAPVALSKPAPVAPVIDTVPAQPDEPTQPGTKVETVPPGQLAERLARIKGIAVVQFSSLDKGCPYCVQSNPRFDTLAQAKGTNVTFLRVMWQPFTQAFDDRLAIQYGLSGLPTFLTFKDGQAVRRVNGNYTAIELNSKLLADLK